MVETVQCRPIEVHVGHTVGHYASLEGDGRPGVARGVNVLDLLPVASDANGGRAWLATKASVTETDLYQRIPLTQFTDNQRGRDLGGGIWSLQLPGPSS